MSRIDNVSLSASRSPDRLAYMAGKFADWIEKGRIPADSSLESIWSSSITLPVRTDYAQSIAWVFGADIRNLDIRKTAVTPNFTLVFILVDGEVIEICTYRTLRGLNHIYMRWLARKPIRRDEAEMLRQMSITKFMTWQVSAPNPSTPEATRPNWNDVLSAEDGVRFIIMRGPASLCAYAGIPEAHPLAGHNYDDLPVRAHGGLTYGSKGGSTWPQGYWWYGWDYAHSGDYSVYDGRFKEQSGDKKWTRLEVESDSWSTLYDFKRLLKLAESIAAKAERGQ